MTGGKRYNMKKIVKTTAKINSALDRLRMERLTGESITDKAMTALSITDSTVILDLHLFEVDTDDGYIQQAIIVDDNGAHSTSSKVVISLVDELIDIINNGDAMLSDVKIAYSYATSKEGNKYLNATLI